MAGTRGLLELLGKGARIGKPIERQMGEATAGLSSDVLDMGLLGSMPDVPQQAMERYVGARGMPKTIPDILTKDAAERLAGYARAGAEIGGLEWYNLEPLRVQFVRELGTEEGTKQFNRFVDYVAATSPRSTVAQNIRRGSYMLGQERQGLDPSALANPDMPPGYGHIAHETQRALLKDLAGGGQFSSLSRPKTSSFAENLRGNWTPLTSDTHNFAAIMGDPTHKVSPSQTQYPYLEQFQAEIGSRLGITPAQMQASVWMGGGTGVKDPRPFIAVFDDVLESTAKKNNTTKANALRDFIVNGAPLYGLAGVTAVGADKASGLMDMLSQDRELK